MRDDAREYGKCVWPCTGRTRLWWGTDGHGGREQFESCEKCGRTR